MSFFDWFAGNNQTQEEAQANINRQAAALQAQDTRRLASGEITQTKVDSDNRFISTVGGAESVQNAYLSGFGEGLNDGAKNVNSAFWSGIGNALKIVPTPVWIAAGVGLFLYMGGGVWLVRKSKGVLAKP